MSPCTARLPGVAAVLVVGARFADALQLDLLTRLRRNGDGAGGHVHGNSHAVGLAHQFIAGALVAAAFEFLGEQRGNLFGRQHFEDFQARADAVAGA